MKEKDCSRWVQLGIAQTWFPDYTWSARDGFLIGKPKRVVFSHSVSYMDVTVWEVQTGH